MTDPKELAARVPMPETHESGVVCLTPDGYAHGNMLEVQLQVPQGSGMRRGDVLYTAEQVIAQKEAVAALVIGEAVAWRWRLVVERDGGWVYSGHPLPPSITEDRACEWQPLYTAPPAPAVDEAMVGRALSLLPAAPQTPNTEWEKGYSDAMQLVRQEMPAALTAALHGDKA